MRKLNLKIRNNRMPNAKLEFRNVIYEEAYNEIN